MGNFFKRLWRKIGTITLLVACVVCVVPLVLYLHWHASRPFQTHDQFVQLLREERFQEAKAMIHASDLASIPDDYWEQFRGRPPVSLIAPTGLTYIDGRMAVAVFFPGGQDILTNVFFFTEGQVMRVESVSRSRSSVNSSP